MSPYTKSVTVSFIFIASSIVNPSDKSTTHQLNRSTQVKNEQEEKNSYSKENTYDQNHNIKNIKSITNRSTKQHILSTEKRYENTPLENKVAPLKCNEDIHQIIKKPFKQPNNCHISQIRKALQSFLTQGLTLELIYESHQGTHFLFLVAESFIHGRLKEHKHRMLALEIFEKHQENKAYQSEIEVSLYRAALKDHHPEIRKKAIELISIYDNAQFFLEDLNVALNDEDCYVYEAAKLTLSIIHQKGIQQNEK